MVCDGQGKCAADDSKTLAEVPTKEGEVHQGHKSVQHEPEELSCKHISKLADGLMRQT